MIQTERELIRALGTVENIIVFGDQAKALSCLECLDANGLYTRVHVAVSNPQNSNRRALTHRVQSIRSLVHLADNSVVLVAIDKKFHTDVEDMLSTLGFGNVISFGDDLVADLVWRYDGYTHSAERKKQEFLQLRTMNMIKQNHLRDKVRSGEKIKVLFLLTSPAKFSFGPIYHAMEKRDCFEVVIFCTDDRYSDLLGPGEFSAYTAELRHQGFHVIEAIREGDAVTVDSLCPDIIFYNNPNMFNRDTGESIYRLVCNYLSCYIPYGLHVSNEFEYHFEHENILPAWLHFCDTRPAYDLCLHHALSGGVNAVLSGHTIFDPYVEETDRKPFEKILNGKKIVVYAPHWSVASWHNTSSFHIHYKYFLSLLKEHPDVNFVFKPHQTLKVELTNRGGKNGIPTAEEYAAYCREWNDSPNGMVVMDSSYIDLFKLSDCLITDSYSFILSWLPSEKPCIFLVNPQGPEDYLKYYYDFIHPVIDSYYTGKTEEEIDAIFHQVVLDGIDPKAEERLQQKEKVLYNYGCAGEFIAEYIERQLRN